MQTKLVESVVMDELKIWVGASLVCHVRSWCRVNVYLFPRLHGSYVPEIPAQSSFAQVIIECTCGKIYKYVQGSPVEIQVP
jgi:hypothetical protein